MISEYKPTNTADDELYQKAIKLVVDTQNASTSFLQRHLSLTFNKGAALVQRMQAAGVVSEADRTGKRRVLWAKE